MSGKSKLASSGTPLRGGGRECGIVAIERRLDLLARRIGRDGVEVRLRNAIEPAEMPYDTGRVRVERYLVVDDCGVAINPLVVDGQVLRPVRYY